MFASRSFIRAIVPVVKTHHKRGLGHFTRTFIFSHVYSSPQRVISRDVGHRIPKKSPVRKDDSVLANEAIPYSEMRVVYQDDRTEKSRWKIMKRMEAIDFARSQSLDLVLVKPPTSDEVAVCILQDYEMKKMDDMKKNKEAPKKKSKPLKQIRVGALCDTHDLNTKLTKIKGFLVDGIQVRVTIFVKKRTAREHPLALDETTIRVLDGLEGHAGPVQSVSKVVSRVEFIVSPIKM